MNKLLVLGDIHGRPFWKEIIEKENPDQVIFLGDYVTTHESISPEQQLSNLEDILSYKEANLDKVILLRGNHDCECLGYYWAECSPDEPKVRLVMSVDPLKSRFESLTQWIYINEDLKTIFSHAGVSQVWMNEVAQVNDVHNINKLSLSEIFGFTPDNIFDTFGTSKTQPPTWIRPQTLCRCNVSGWDQVIGHSPVTEKITNIKPATKENRNIWCCDALALKQYLIIDNGNFQPKTFKQ